MTLFQASPHFLSSHFPPPSLIHTPVCLTWVRNHHQDAVGAVLDDVGDDELEDVDVALDQVETALALLLAGAGRHHHHFGVCCHTVV